tara:strand:- start:3892 stop:4857 length:966 start_codon:yes stop_codon:yes gene_type:complete
MTENKILVTGCAGFIGFHLAKSLLNDNINVYGIDNINDYYDVNLKHNRLKQLEKYSNFKFAKIDISNHSDLSNIFSNFNPSIVVNLAAQAGVRYSIENPFAYMSSNIVGFLNLIELCKDYKVNGLIYASSSSVYGGNKKIPFSVNDRVDKPISLYAASKRSNELIAYTYSHLYNLHTTGLRFFTVYGPWGRPDMAMYIFADNISKGKDIKVFNNGDMYRDFTYIDDIVHGIRKSIDKNYKCEVFNLGNNKSEKLLDIVKYIENNLNLKASMKFKPIQPGDVKTTNADIDRSIKMLDYKPSTNVDIGIEKFISWYKKYNSII